jgi:hypothetical protein
LVRGLFSTFFGSRVRGVPIDGGVAWENLEKFIAIEEREPGDDERPIIWMTDSTLMEYLKKIAAKLLRIVIHLEDKGVLPKHGVVEQPCDIFEEFRRLTAKGASIEESQK